MTQFLTHFIAHHRFHFTEMRELYVSLSLRALALGVGGLFAPLFLYDIGYSLVMIAAFFVVAMGIKVGAEFAAAWLVARIGVKHTLSLSFAFLFGYFISLYFLPQLAWLWVPAAAFLGFEMALFWVSYHLRVSSVRSQARASTQVGITIILRRVSMAIGPLAGGFLAAVYGVEYTLLAAAACLLLAAYPLFRTPDTRVRVEVAWSEFKLGLLQRDSLAHISHQLSQIAALHWWPLWLLLVLGSYSQIGMIIALSIVVGIGLTLWVGRLGDQGKNTLLLRIGSGIKMVSHGARVAGGSFGAALFANVLNDLSENFSAGPFTEKFYEAADRGKRVTYILRMNVVSAVGTVLIWSVLLSLLLMPGMTELVSLQVMFVLAALTVPMMLWVSRRPREAPEEDSQQLRELQPAPESVAVYDSSEEDRSEEGQTQRDM